MANENDLTIKAGDILMSPKSQTTMWRALEVQPDRIRLVRSGKTGEIHGLVKKREGEWLPANDLSQYKVIGHFSGPTRSAHAEAGKTISTKGKTKAHPGKKISSKGFVRHATKPTAQRATVAAGPGGDTNREVLRFMKTTLDSLSRGLSEYLREPNKAAR